MPERRQLRVSGGLEARSERPATGHGEPEAGLGSGGQSRNRHPHWFILSRGVPAPTSSGRGRASGTVASSGATVTAMLL